MSDVQTVPDRVEAWIRRWDLIPPGGDVTCLVSGGADSTCLWHVLRELGYRVSAVHVDHGLRGSESDEDAEHCRTALGADVHLCGSESRSRSEAELRELRYRLTADRGLRATAHTASDQVETVLYRLVSSGNTRGIKVRREDGVVRPLLTIWRPETEVYCAEHGLPFRTDSSNQDTMRGLVRHEILPLLRRLHPGADANLLALAQERPRLPRALEASLVELLSSRAGTKGADLGGGIRAVREYDTLRLEGEVRWGPWTLSSDLDGLEVRSRRPGDRLAGRRKKVQDLLVDAKVPRLERDGWPLVVRGDDIVSVPGIADAPGFEGAIRSRRAVTMVDLEAGVGEVLIEEGPLQSRIEELGREISVDYEGRDLLLVGVLKGAVFFLADLMRRLSVPCEIDFMAISSYGERTDSSGVVRILKDLDESIAGRDVLVVEDIIDSGLTLSYLMRSLTARKPATLEVCALLTKPERREIEVPVRYVGFEIPNKFVIGYGLDFAERYRNLPYIGVLRPDLVADAT